jgi:poly-gamma-glutamate capsule biosynthesis protein CapA/YwtB (metallophosphatase superfamily)
MGAAPVRLFLCGDVMTGRGIDQILPHPSDPRLYEFYVNSARDYVALAEDVSGRIERPVDYAYIWGDALAELERMRPDARIVNLETAVTAAGEPWPGKGIHYRMHPANVACLRAARLDCCVLANNHVMDWGRAGLAETLATLSGAGIHTAGAGRDAVEAAAPAVIDTHGDRRVLVYAFGMESAGVPAAWRAQERGAGVNWLADLSGRSLDAVARSIAARKRSGDVVVVSVHWGANWGFDVAPEQRAFAQALLDGAGADVVHGHSSHHIKGIEVHRGKLILYGCGDFLNDYEGIGGYEAYRGELALMYFPLLAEDGRLLELALTPTRTRRLRVNRAGPEDTAWLFATLNREGGRLGTRAEQQPDGTLRLRWD